MATVSEFGVKIIKKESNEFTRKVKVKTVEEKDKENELHDSIVKELQKRFPKEDVTEIDISKEETDLVLVHVSDAALKTGFEDVVDQILSTQEEHNNVVCYVSGATSLLVEQLKYSTNTNIISSLSEIEDL